MNFGDFLRNVNIPVIVYREDDAKTVVYENRNAIMQFNPLAKSQDWQYIDSNTPITSLLKLPQSDFDDFFAILDDTDGDITNFNTTIQLYSGESTPVSLAANRVTINNVSYVQIFVYSIHSEHLSLTHAQALAAVLEVAYKATTTDESIENALAFSGNYINVSRTYIFESISDDLTSNTYEWCAPGVVPAIEQLKNLPKDEYSYDDIIENGLAITDDIRNLSEEDQVILEPQGIKSLAIIPIYYRGAPLGYVGFDDCSHYRKWSSGEVQFLQSLADILASLLARRNAEQSIRYSLNVLNVVTDNTENMIIVVDPHKNEFLFANSAVARSVGTPANELIGQNAREIMQIWAGSLNQKEFNQLMGITYLGDSDSRSWEFNNAKNGKWYLARGSVIKWIDGKDVYLVNFTEITGQKEYAAQLEHAASTDMMTGLYNREWGRQLLQHILDNKSSSSTNSLVFIDLDSLKKTNDKYGHGMGDAMILRTIEFIKMCIRRSDTLCRWGGDEFVLIVRTDEEQTLALINKIKKLMSEHNETKKDIFKISFSFGIVGIHPNSDQTVDSIIKEADEKMYQDKMRLHK